jgi:DNA-binding MarR family transcriptional regulator
MNWHEQLAQLTSKIVMAKHRTETEETRNIGGSPRDPLGNGKKSAWKYSGIRGWQAEHSISRLFRTSIRLQRALDRCFSELGMTAQEAGVLLHCADAGETSAGQLATAIGRDKAKITRFVDRLKANGFLSRESNPRDHRLSIIKTTNRGRRVAPHLKARFEEVRAQFFEGVLNIDIDRLETVLQQLHANAERLCEEKHRKVERE